MPRWGRISLRERPQKIDGHFRAWLERRQQATDAADTWFWNDTLMAHVAYGMTGGVER